MTTQDVFVSGRVDASSAYDTFRIPALCRTSKGTLLAFAEGRKSVGDQSSNELVLRRREAGSEDWGPLQVVQADAPNSLNNPCVLATKGGRVWMMYQRYPSGIGERSVEAGYSLEKSCTAFVTYSDDDGKSWSTPRNVSEQVKFPIMKSLASGPGVGIELERGKHKGRLVFPFNGGGNGDYNDFVAYSDDKGKTWKRGDLAPKVPGTNPNECQVAELVNGDLYFNSRNQAKTHMRLTSVSRDGGKSWSTMTLEPTLVDPVCQGSLVRVSFSPDILAFTNADSESGRKNGTIRFSRDGGKTWPVGKVIVPGSFSYSCLCPLSGSNLGLLYEAVDQVAGVGEVYRLKYTTLDVPAD